MLGYFKVTNVGVYEAVETRAGMYVDVYTLHMAFETKQMLHFFILLKY